MDGVAGDRAYRWWAQKKQFRESVQPSPLADMQPNRQANYVAEEAHALYCFDVLSSYFANVAPPQPAFQTDIVCPLFVTWNKQQGRSGHLQLRGCIGCLKPLAITSLCDYALTSALHDRRFAPIEEMEMPRLQCTVQLLGVFEPCELYDWTVGVHGVTISFVERGINATRSAVYLPDVIPEQGWTKEQAIDSLIRKSGCEQPITDELRDSLEVCRFVSTRYTVPYERWASLRMAPPAQIHSMPPPVAPSPTSQRSEASDY